MDSQLFRGTAYKASGWTLLGQTQGWGRAREDFYVKHERPKQLWVRELKAGACWQLSQAVLPPELVRIEGVAQACCLQTPVQLEAAARYFGATLCRRRNGGQGFALHHGINRFWICPVPPHGFGLYLPRGVHSMPTCGASAGL